MWNACDIQCLSKPSTYWGVKLYYIEKKNKIKKRIVIFIWLLLIVICVWKNVQKSNSTIVEGGVFSLQPVVMQYMEESVLSSQMPILLFANQEKSDGSMLEWFLGMAVREISFYAYWQNNYSHPLQTESKSTYALLIEREEGRDEEGSMSENAFLPDDSMADALYLENEQAKAERMEEENMEVIQEQGIFLPALQKSVEFNFEDYREFDKLLSGFYILDNTTTIDASQLNVDTLLAKDMKMIQSNDKPQILIYHTHSQEGFVDSIPGDASTTIMGAGEKLARILREEYGFHVIHHTGQYDVESRDYAYSNAEPAWEQILAENQSIEVIIYLHRDEVPAERKLVIDLNGRPTAMFMFFNGLSRTKQRGDIDYLYNPYINDNLAFSFQMQVASNEYYPGITRKIYLKGYRYNMHYRPKSLLIELGAQTNTVEEIMNACDPLAHIISMVLKGEA